MKELLKNCCQAAGEKQYYLYCGLGNIVAYVRQVDWGMVLSTVLMLVGIYADWKRKRKRKIEDEERKEKELNEQLALIRQKNERELQLKIEENKTLSDTVEKLFNRIDEKDRQINKLMNYIQNREFEITEQPNDRHKQHSGSRRAAQSKNQ